MKKNEPVTQAQIEGAIRRFLEQGGMIRRLPDQKSYQSRAVGARNSASAFSAAPRS